LLRLHTLLARGLTATAALWPDIRTAYTWVHRAAHLLTNAAGQDVYALRRDLDHRQEARRAQRRFRRDSTTYLAQIEAALRQSSLPP
jgi:hypothetical protein